MYKMIRQSPMTVLEWLIHLFGTWILVAAIRLLALLTRGTAHLKGALTYHWNTTDYCEHLLLALLLLLAFSFLLCKCVKEKNSKKR